MSDKIISKETIELTENDTKRTLIIEIYSEKIRFILQNICEIDGPIYEKEITLTEFQKKSKSLTLINDAENLKTFIDARINENHLKIKEINGNIRLEITFTNLFSKTEIIEILFEEKELDKDQLLKNVIEENKKLNKEIEYLKTENKKIKQRVENLEIIVNRMKIKKDNKNIHEARNEHNDQSDIKPKSINESENDNSPKIKYKSFLLENNDLKNAGGYIIFNLNDKSDTLIAFNNKKNNSHYELYNETNIYSLKQQKIIKTLWTKRR